MANKKVITTREYRDADEEPKRLPAEVIPDQRELTWSAFVGKFPGRGTKVKIYRATPRGKQYCFFGTPEEIDEEAIRIFHAKQPYAAEPGDYYLALEIDGELQEPFHVPIAPQISTPGSDPHASAGGGAVQEVIRMLQAQN